MNEEEKDLVIKAKLSPKKDMPENINNLFNNVLDVIERGSNMEENNIKEDVKVNKNKKEIIKKSIIGIAACMLISLGGGNIYATTQGYGNVFFMIKEWFSNINVNNKDEILADRDLTISFEEIEIVNNLKVIVNKLQVKDGVAKLFLKYSEEEVDPLLFPLKYKVYNNSANLMCEQEGVRKKNERKYEYTDEIIINNFNNEEILVLEINDSNNNNLKTLKIDLVNKVIEIQKSEEIKKISEIELKNFLNYESAMEKIYLNELEEDSEKINESQKNQIRLLAINRFLSENNLWENHKISKEYYGVMKVNTVKKVAKNVFNEEIGTVSANDFYTTYKENGVEYYVMKSGSDVYATGTCININDITYKDGIYKVTFTYAYYPESVVSQGEYNIKDYDIYQNTISMKYDENNSYSKFLVVGRENIKKVDSEKVSNLNDEEKIKEVLQKYLDLRGTLEGSAEDVLNQIGFNNLSDNPYITANYYAKTNIKYSEYKKRMLVYMSEEMFENHFTSRFQNVNGDLYYFYGGATGIDYKVNSITIKGDYSKLNYIANIYFSVDMESYKEEANIEFHVEKKNGNYIITYIDTEMSPVENKLKECLKDSDWIKNNISLKSEEKGNEEVTDEKITYIICKNNNIIIQVESEQARIVKCLLISYKDNNVNVKEIGTMNYYNGGYKVDANKNVVFSGYLNQGFDTATYYSVNDNNVEIIGQYQTYTENEITYSINENNKLKQVSKKEFENYKNNTINDSQYKLVDIGTDLTNENVDKYVK